jgi:uncharacterized surface protein with fasciclin (FAS1) repeats
MTHRFYMLPLLLLASALILAGCDQSSQNPGFSSGDSYIINLENSAAGDGEATSAMVPDTLDYSVQGFTIEKDYTWTVNGTEPPVEPRADQTYMWERRGGEFITIVVSPDDPLATTDSETTSHTITVDASPDDIEPGTVELTATIPSAITTQLGRLSDFSALDEFATPSDIAEVIAEGGPLTVLGPQSFVLNPRLSSCETGCQPTPTQATDDDEPATSSVRADLLKYHAIPASVASGDISDGQTVSTLLGDQELTFSVSDGDVTVDGAQVVYPDVPLSNDDENLHGIDGLLTPSTASVDFTDRSKDPAPAAGDTITVDGTFFPADVDANGGGYIVLHDSTELENQGALVSIVGKSEYVNPGVQNEVAVVLDEAISDTTSLGAMAHRDSDGDMTYDFETSAGTEDGPYTLSGAPVIDYGVINPPDSN